MPAQSPRPLSVVWAAISLAVLAGWFYIGMHWSETAWDFTLFYVAAHAPLDSIHDQAAFREAALPALAGTGVTYIPPYVRPAVFALALRWMKGMPYWNAYLIWAGLQFVFYSATLWLLARYLGVRVVGFYPWALVFPVFFSIITGQDALTLGLILCGALVLLMRGSDTLGGALLSLTLYKFNLFLLLPVYLLLKKRYRALAAYSICGALLAIASAALEPPSLYISLLPRIEEYTIGTTPSIMLGLRGLLASLGWGAVYPVAAVALAAYLLFQARRMEFARGFGMAVMACILCAYHAGWYDGAVLILPLGLAVSQGGVALRRLAMALMVIPFWNAVPAVVSMALIGFAALYVRDRDTSLAPTSVPPASSAR